MKALSPGEADAARRALLRGETTIAELRRRYPTLRIGLIEQQTGWLRMSPDEQAPARARARGRV
jgi:hypothetical protein